MAKHRLTKATDIPKKVKDAVWERDSGKCLVCGYYPSIPACHIVSRAHSGRGIETNLCTLCMEHHRLYDSGTREQRDTIDRIVVAYMKSIYGEGWNKEDQVYHKWQ